MVTRKINISQHSHLQIMFLCTQEACYISDQVPLVGCPEVKLHMIVLLSRDQIETDWGWIYIQEHQDKVDFLRQNMIYSTTNITVKGLNPGESMLWFE